MPGPAAPRAPAPSARLSWLPPSQVQPESEGTREAAAAGGQDARESSSVRGQPRIGEPTLRRAQCMRADGRSIGFAGRSESKRSSRPDGGASGSTRKPRSSTGALEGNDPAVVAVQRLAPQAAGTLELLVWPLELLEGIVAITADGCVPCPPLERPWACALGMWTLQGAPEQLVSRAPGPQYYTRVHPQGRQPAMLRALGGDGAQPAPAAGLAPDPPGGGCHPAPIRIVVSATVGICLLFGYTSQELIGSNIQASACAARLRGAGVLARRRSCCRVRCQRQH